LIEDFPVSERTFVGLSATGVARRPRIPMVDGGGLVPVGYLLGSYRIATAPEPNSIDPKTRERLERDVAMSSKARDPSITMLERRTRLPHVRTNSEVPSFGELLNGSIGDRIRVGHENSLEWQRAHLRN
jgi:hypothetical protein